MSGAANRMRVLLVTEDIPAPQVGGLGKHVVTLGNALLSLGHDVALLGRADQDYAACAAEIGFKGRFIAGFHLQRSGWKEAQLGVWMPFKRPHLASRIEAAIRRHAGDFDVVHYHGHLPMVGLGLPATLPLLQTRHDQGSECLTHVRFVNGQVCERRDPRDCAACVTSQPSAWQSTVSAAAVRQYRGQVADNFASRPTLFVSDFLRQQFLRAMPEADLSGGAVVHNFIDLQRLRRLAEGISPVSGRVVLAGRVDQAKGFGAFLRSWTQAGCPGSPQIIGDGPELASLKSEYGDTVEFWGWRPYEEAVRATAAAHVCVVPSVWQEPFGTTALEALALGRPCLALARGGTPEMLAFQRYPGQLQLAEDMPALIHLLRNALDRPAQPEPPASDFPVDVRQVVNQVLAAYNRTRRSAGLPALSEY